MDVVCWPLPQEYYYEYDGDLSIDGAAAATDRPWIDAPVMPTNVTVVAGRTAILACVVKEVGTASVRRRTIPKDKLYSGFE